MYRNHNILALILVSLAFLLAFISLWLNSAYQKEKQNLQKEANQLFSNAIRAVEDSIINQMISPSITVKRTDTMPTSILEFRSFSFADTNKVIRINDPEKRKIKQIKKDSNFTFTIRSRLENNLQEDIVGSLSLFIAMGEKDSLSHYPEMERSDSVMLEKLLTSRFRQTNLPVEFTLIRQPDSFPAHGQIRSAEYRDIWSEQRYALQFENFNWYLIEKIAPQIAFSFTLFLIITLAFYAIFRNLQKEQRLRQLKNEFISNVTHELKTPIATVSVAMEALSDFDGLKNPERTKEYLDISRHELNRLSILVDKVLKMSLFEHQGLKLELETIDIKKLSQEIVNSMQLQFQKNQAKASIHQQGSSFLLQGDRTHLTNVLYNLLDNALKYRNGTPEIHITLAEKEQSIECRVRDNGIGIPAEYQNKIFEKFFRVPSGDLHNIKGHGLGLSYVANVINKHGGTITVESTPGKGTQFIITLPKRSNT